MGRTVVIVEDTQHSACTLEIALLAIPNVSVSHASSGLQALELLKRLDPSAACAIVTDLQMPSMDGFELIERVRSDTRYAHLPIVVISGDPNPGTPSRIRRLGANAYFPKPYSPVEVRNKVEELLNAYAP